MEEVKRRLNQRAMEEQQRVVMDHVAAHRCKFIDPEGIEEFEEQFHGIKERTKPLVLVGPGGVGKTAWALGFFGRNATRARAFLEARQKILFLTCTGEHLPDVSQYEFAPGHCATRQNPK